MSRFLFLGLNLELSSKFISSNLISSTSLNSRNMSKCASSVTINLMPKFFTMASTLETGFLISIGT